MIDSMIDRIRALELDREYRALATHIAVTSPQALEVLANEHGNSVSHEALRMAAMQLRVVHDLAGRLRWLECACVDPSIDPGVRAGLTAILRSLTNSSELLPVVDSHAAVLLEPALLFHALMSRLRPWLPPPWSKSVLAFEADAVLEQLQLGIADYLHPLLRQRFEALWKQFHQLRQLPLARLSLLTDPPRIDAARLLRLLEDPQLSARACPPAPPWVAPRWAASGAVPEPWYASSELTG